MTNGGDAENTAFAAWVQVSLAQRFNVALHEPVPQALLAILEVGAESDTALISVRDGSGPEGF